MELSPFTRWLNKTFKKFDYTVLRFAYDLHDGPFGSFWDRWFSVFTLLGEDGIFLMGLSLSLMFSKKTKKTGAAMFLSIFLSALFANITIKNIVERQRPYINKKSVYRRWWTDVGHGLEKEVFSFPSGHATAAFATMTAFFMTGNKKYSWSGYLFALMMGFSRVYLMVHYPTDVLGGAAVGSGAGIAATALANMIFFEK